MCVDGCLSVNKCATVKMNSSWPILKQIYVSECVRVKVSVGECVWVSASACEYVRIREWVSLYKISVDQRVFVCVLLFCMCDIER